MEREHLKSNLLRSVGHDLRTPLTGIAGSSSYIAEKSESLDRKSIGHMASEINEQAVWLTMLVENILNMTRIDNGRLTVSKQTEVVDDVVNEAVSHVIGLSDHKLGIMLPSELVAIPMDGRMIVQVLVNLLDNAVKHTPKGSSIELAVAKKGDKVEFSVADSGPGISPALAENLFEAFAASVENLSDGKKGIGLGLAICKAAVEAHGGTIQTGTSHLGGALFSFDLPYTEEQ
jgi:two-component system sensor histidine kinase KdpD